MGWVLTPGEHRPTLQTLYFTPHQHRHGSAHLHTSPAPVAQSVPLHQVFSAPIRLPSKVLNQKPSLGLRKPCSVSLAARYFSCSFLTTTILHNEKIQCTGKMNNLLNSDSKSIIECVKTYDSRIVCFETKYGKITPIYAWIHILSRIVLVPHIHAISCRLKSVRKGKILREIR